MKLTGQTVKHRFFGAGTVAEQGDGTVTIRFEGEEKRFIYPDAFESFLTLEDRRAQRSVEKLLKDREMAEEKEKQAQQTQQDHLRKMLNFKIVVNSHAVFHLTPEQAVQAAQTGRVSTGVYLSGPSRGQPRAADRLKPNSVCLLTTCRNGQEESRRLVGAFMVGEDFFGEDRHEGMIEGHPQHRLFLPGEDALPLWTSFARPAPQRWGSAAFKYCSGSVARQLLTDLAAAFPTGDPHRRAAEFYRYFCRMNHLRSLMAPEEEPACREA